jgi:hypothetical protein
MLNGSIGQKILISLNFPKGAGMITIGKRVKYVIDEIAQSNFEIALEHVAIALDVTAKKHYKSDKSTGSNYKNLLTEYSWLVEMMAFGGINLGDSKFGNYPLPGYPEPTLQELIYHAICCNLVHDEGVPETFEFSDADSINTRSGHLVFPNRLIWGPLSIVVFNPSNVNEKTADGYWLSIFENQFQINDFWGQEHVAKHVYEKRNLIRVTLIVPKQSQ